MNLFNLVNKEVTQEEILNYYNVSIIYENLPTKINGCVTSYRNINLIIINNNLSYYKKRNTLLHELAHIELNQLNQINNNLFAFKIDKYEDEADRYLKKLSENLDK